MSDTNLPSRFERAVEQDLRVRALPCGDYHVTNHSHDDPAAHRYSVTVERGSVTGCDCPDATFRGVVCKHQVAVIRARAGADR